MSGAWQRIPALTAGLALSISGPAGAQYVELPPPGYAPRPVPSSVIQYSVEPPQTLWTIGGWVALWRPMEIFLYSRWPIKRMQKLYTRLANMEIRIAVAGESQN